MFGLGGGGSESEVSGLRSGRFPRLRVPSLGLVFSMETTIYYI